MGFFCGFCRDFSVYPYLHYTALQLGIRFLPLHRSREVILCHFTSLKIAILKMSSFSLYFISLAFSEHDIFTLGVLFFSEIVIIYCFCFMFGLSVVLSASRRDLFLSLKKNYFIAVQDLTASLTWCVTELSLSRKGPCSFSNLGYTFLPNSLCQNSSPRDNPVNWQRFCLPPAAN